jgi:hypothetical protein
MSMEKRRIPKFESEAEEAKWLYDHREEFAQDFVDAAREGRLGPGIKVRWAERQRKLAAEAEVATQSASAKSSQAA